tara:strand:- start:95 stop:565 length:471 start_codon:yes stop_codon:yes gene_type:complete
MIKLVAYVCVLCMAATPVWANTPDVNLSTPVGKVTEINLGERAPFKGILFSEDAAASLFANLKLTDTECRLRLKKELDINTAMFNSQIEALNLRLSIETKRANDILEIKNERIQFLEENWTPPSWYESGEFWFAVGAVVGIALTAVSAYALGQAAK